MSFGQSILDDLARKAIMDNDADAHQQLTELGYEFQSANAYWSAGIETRIGWYWGQGLLSGKSKSFHYKVRKTS